MSERQEVLDVERRKPSCCAESCGQLRSLLFRAVAMKLRAKRMLLVDVLLPCIFFLISAGVYQALKPELFAATGETSVWTSLPVISEAMDSTMYDNILNKFRQKHELTGIFPNQLYFSKREKRMTIGMSPKSIAEKFLKRFRFRKLMFPKHETDILKLYDDRKHMIDKYEDDDIRFGINFLKEPDSSLAYEIIVDPLHVPPVGETKAGNGSCYRTLKFLKHQPNIAEWPDKQKVIMFQNCLAILYTVTQISNVQLLIDADFTMHIGTKLSSKQSCQNFDFWGQKRHMYMFDYRFLPKKKHLLETSTGQIFITLCTVMSLSPFVNFLMVNIVYEKEVRIKDGLKMLGMNEIYYGLSWLIVYSVEIFFASLLSCAIVFIPKYGIFQHSSFTLFWFVFFLYGETILVLALAISPFFEKAVAAGVFGSLFTAFISLLYLVAANTKESYYSGPIKYGLSIFSPTAMAQAFEIIFKEEIAGEGLGWSSHQCCHESELYTFVLLIASDFVLYFVLYLYFEYMMSCGYGRFKRLVYFLIPSYWFGKKHTEEQLTEMRQVPPLFYVPTKDIENIPNNHNLKVAIELIGLRKEFKSGEFVAVDNLSFKIYEGHITCLLGTNGAGKTTTINMITGILRPTSGTILIHGLDVMSPSDLSKIRKDMGICPQFDILYDYLTPKEHLAMICYMKGNHNREKVKNMTANLLNEVDLTSLANELTANLTIAQKRKLSIAMALICDPKIVFLDEPSSGLDPAARRIIWTVLQNHKANKTILLTTHFMDEADILADRKAIIAKGRLRCMGSSLFLKNRFGFGYHLSLSLRKNFNGQQIYDLITDIIPGAELARCQNKEMDFVLPAKHIDNFASLFKKFEEIKVPDSTSQSADASHRTKTLKQILGIRTYGISMTTLEEVFLRIAEEDGDKIIHHPKQTPVGAMIEEKPINREQSLALVKSIQEKRVQNMPGYSWTGPSLIDFPLALRAIASNTVKRSFRNLFFVTLVIWLKISYRNPFALISRVAMPMILLIVGFALLKRNTYSSTRSTGPVHNLYPKVKIIVNRSTCGVAFYDCFILGNHLLNFSIELKRLPDTKPIHDLIHIDCCHMKTSDFNNSTKCSFLKESKNISSFSNLPILKTLMHGSVPETTITIFAISARDSMIHAVPKAVNMLNNILFSKGHFTKQYNDSNPIETSIVAFSERPELKITLQLVWATLMVGMALSAPGPSYAATVVHHREKRIMSLLQVSSVKFEVYWHSMLLSHVLQSILLIILLPAVIAAFDVPSLNIGPAHVITFFLTFTYIIQAILFCYLLSFAFTRYEACLTEMPIIIIVLGFIPFMIPAILYLIHEDNLASIFHKTLATIDPPYIIYGGIFQITRAYIMAHAKHDLIETTIYWRLDNEVSYCILMNIVHTLILYPCLRIADAVSSGRSIREAFYIPYTAEPDMDNNLLEESEEKDVQRMRKFAEDEDLYTDTSIVTPPLVVANRCQKVYKHSHNCLRGFYKVGCCGCGRLHDAKRRNEDSTRKAAVCNLSISTFFGEIFGLLGPTGAGKSTTLKMITGELPPTKGKILVALEPAGAASTARLIGYCPQTDAVFEGISVREHLDYYAMTNGMNDQMREQAVNFFLEALQIREHSNKYARNLSGGTRRKLSFAIAMLGSPKVVLLDEPSTGMDPQSKRFMWNAILWAFQGEKGAILTTQSMEEAEALCDRVGILVAGKLKCLGTSQHLKDIYGKGYYLEVKAKVEENESFSLEKKDAIKMFIEDKFKKSTMIDCCGEMMKFHIPKQTAPPLAYAFEVMENAKNKQHLIIEYSLSQATLEQVFLTFAKGQEVETRQEKSHSNPLHRDSSILFQELSEESSIEDYAHRLMTPVASGAKLGSRKIIQKPAAGSTQKSVERHEAHAGAEMESPPSSDDPQPTVSRASTVLESLLKVFSTPSSRNTIVERPRQESLVDLNTQPLSSDSNKKDL